MIEETFRYSETYTLIAQDLGVNNTFLGFMMGSFLGDAAELYAIAVEENFKRTGIGSALLENFMEEAVSLNVRSIFLEVGETNERALAFYKSYGFEKLSKRKNYYLNSQTDDGPIFTDAVVLRKNL